MISIIKNSILTLVLSALLSEKILYQTVSFVANDVKSCSILTILTHQGVFIYSTTVLYFQTHHPYFILTLVLCFSLPDANSIGQQKN